MESSGKRIRELCEQPYGEHRQRHAGRPEHADERQGGERHPHLPGRRHQGMGSAHAGRQLAGLALCERTPHDDVPRRVREKCGEGIRVRSERGCNLDERAFDDRQLPAQRVETRWTGRCHAGGCLRNPCRPGRHHDRQRHPGRHHAHHHIGGHQPPGRVHRDYVPAADAEKLITVDKRKHINRINNTLNRRHLSAASCLRQYTSPSDG